jgi:hypothetical protein
MAGFLQMKSIKYSCILLALCSSGTYTYGQCKYEVGSLTIVDVSCHGGDDGAIYLDIHGINGAPITIKWLNIPNHPIDDPNPEDLKADTYFLRVVDSAGCADTLDFVVSEPPSLVVVPNNVTVCAGTTINLLQSVVGGVPGYTYQWTSTAGYSCYGCNNTEVVITQAVEFNVTITDSNGCTADQEVIVGSNPAIQMTRQTFPEICGHDGAIDVAPTGGTPPFEFRLNGGNYQPQPNFTGLHSGQYLVEARDAQGCMIEKTATVVDRTTNVALQPVATAVSCPGAQDGQIFAWSNPNSVNGFSIDSLSFQSPPVFQFLNGGTYQVYAQDTNGCVVSAQVNVYEPVAPNMEVQGIDLSCFGAGDGIVIVSTSGGSYPVESYELDGNAQPSMYFSNVSAGPHTVICTDTTGCAYSTTVTLSEPDQIVLDSADVVSVSCHGEEDGSFVAYVSGGTGGFRYSIDGTNFQSSNAFSGLGAGTYALSIEDSSGCTITEVINVIEPPEVVISTYIAGTTCYHEKDGEIIVITSGGATVSDFSLNGGDWQLSNTFPELPAGVYLVQVRDTHGCVYSANAEVTEPDPIEIDGHVTSDSGTAGIVITVQGGNGGYTFAWSNGDSTQNISGLSPGIYVVTVTDSLGCTETEPFVVSGTSLPNLPDEDVVFLYPNPTSGVVLIDLQLSSTKRIGIETLDLLGQVLTVRPETDIRNQIVEIDLSAMAAGVYLVRLNIDGESFISKIVKQ